MRSLFVFFWTVFLIPFLSAEKIVCSSLSSNGWYPDSREVLEQELNEYLREAVVADPGSVKALVVPHAGYRSSGNVAAFGYKSVMNQNIKRVVVIGPSHRQYLSGYCGTSRADIVETPLGRVEIDQTFVGALLKTPWFKEEPMIDEAEHSLHIQYPFIQKTMKEAKVVPIMTGELEPEQMMKIAEVLKGLLDETTLIIVSSDFTHYGPRFDYVPFEENIPENLEKLDRGAYAWMEKGDAKGFWEYCRETGITVCGRTGITLLLNLLPPGVECRNLCYDTSGNKTGDFSNSVSYLAAAFTGPSGSFKEEKKGLTADEKKALLSMARRTLEEFLLNGTDPQTEAFSGTLTPGMKEVRGAFVTLHQNRELRGCIGEIFPGRPLYQAVREHAVNAGVHDPRFEPVRSEDLDSLEFEISALTPPHPVKSLKEIILGKHGIVLRKGGFSAVFLPQVASEQGWDLETTLNALSRKAGLSEEAWKEGADFLVFEAEVFSESLQAS